MRRKCISHFEMMLLIFASSILKTLELVKNNHLLKTATNLCFYKNKKKYGGSVDFELALYFAALFQLLYPVAEYGI